MISSKVKKVRRLSNRDRDIFLALLGSDEPNKALKAAAAEDKAYRAGVTPR